MIPSTVLHTITQERIEQDMKWGAYRDQPDMTWISILLKEVLEVAQATIEHDAVRMKTELVQVAAVAIAWLEAIERET